jgi:ferredoxin
MPALKPAVGQHALLPRTGLSELIRILRAEGFTVIAPALRDGVITLAPIESVEQLATGLRDEQSPGSYRVVQADPGAFFQHVVGPNSPKRFVFPPQMRLFSMHVTDKGMQFDAGPPKPPKLALLGIRPCDLAALRAFDRVFHDASRCESDLYFTQTRREMVTVVVNCTRPGGTCFCASMGTGPAATDGFDLSLTELRGGFVVKVGSSRGAQLAGSLDVREPSAAELELAELRLEQAREHMGRAMPNVDVPDLLKRGIEHPHWDEIAKKCLACGNCTMVCPTCFCSAVVDGNDLSGGGVRRTRLWDSCYTHQFSYTTAGPVRSSIRAEHRHWVRHKLCTYWEQFGCGGCVGCGRCITWCPVGIDITAELAQMRGTKEVRS